MITTEQIEFSILRKFHICTIMVLDYFLSFLNPSNTWTLYASFKKIKCRQILYFSYFLQFSWSPTTLRERVHCTRDWKLRRERKGKDLFSRQQNLMQHVVKIVQILVVDEIFCFYFVKTFRGFFYRGHYETNKRWWNLLKL